MFILLINCNINCVEHYLHRVTVLHTTVYRHWGKHFVHLYALDNVYYKKQNISYVIKVKNFGSIPVFLI